MAETTRTLEIVLKARDLFTRHFQAAGHTFMSVVRGFGAGFRALGAGFSFVKNAVVGFAGIFASAFAASRMAAFVGSTIEQADSLHKLAVALGSTTERLSALKAAFDFSGIGADFESTIKGLSKALSQIFTRGPDTRQGNALRQLGIDLNTIKDSDPLSLLEGIAKGLEQYGSEAEKAAVLSAIFGNAFDTKLLVLLGRGEAEFNKNIDAAKLYGAVLRGDLAEAAEAAGDQLGFIRLQFSTAFRDAVLSVAKAMTPLLMKLNEFMQAIRPQLVEGLEVVVRLLLILAVRVGQFLLLFLTQAADGFRSWKIAVADFLRVIPLVGEQMAKSVLGGLHETVRLERALLNARIAAQNAAAGIEMIRQTGRGTEWLPGLEQALKNSRALAEDLAAKLDLASGRESVSEADRLRVQVLQQELDKLIAIINARETLSTGGSGRMMGFDPDFAKSLPGEKETEQVRTFWQTFGDGATEAGRRFVDFTTDVKARIDDLVTNSLNQLSDAMTDWITGAKSAKEAFKDMARSIIRDIVSWITKLIVLWIWQVLTRTSGGGRFTGAGGAPTGTPAPPTIQNAEGGVTSGLKQIRQLAHGGVLRQMSHSLPMRKFQRGGIATAPTIAIFGEAGAEAFVPLQGGRIPVNIRGGGNQTTMTFNINAVDGRSVRQLLIEERATIQAIHENALARSRSLRGAVKGV